MTYTTRFEDLAGVEAVIEAIAEDARQVGLQAARSPSFRTRRFLACNTPRSRSPSWRAATSRPERILGLHFFTPVRVMKLVEVVVALDTADETVAPAEGSRGRSAKTPIRTKDRSGFIVNMLLVPYLMAAVRMYEEGFASREDIDEGMKLGCGHPMGPAHLSDFIGLDVLYSVSSRCTGVQARRVRAAAAAQADGRLGHHGRKTGRGFYEYSFYEYSK